MVVTLTHTSVNSVFYSAATALIRYIYIKTSLQTNIQAVIKRNAFMWKSVFIIESLGCYNLASFYLLHKEKQSPVYYPLLYQSCLDPWTTSYSLLLFKVMPINQFLIHAASWCIVGFNLILYKHKQQQHRSDSYRSNKDPKKKSCSSQSWNLLIYFHVDITTVSPRLIQHYII